MGERKRGGEREIGEKREDRDGGRWCRKRKYNNERNMKLEKQEETTCILLILSRP